MLFLHIYIFIDVDISKLIYTDAHIHIYSFLYVNIYIRIYMYQYNVCVYICTHIYMFRANTGSFFFHLFIIVYICLEFLLVQIFPVAILLLFYYFWHICLELMVATLFSLFFVCVDVYIYAQLRVCADDYYVVETSQKTSKLIFTRILMTCLWSDAQRPVYKEMKKSLELITISLDYSLIPNEWMTQTFLSTYSCLHQLLLNTSNLHWWSRLTWKWFVVF